MYSPAANRLRDATAAVRTRSPLGTPPLSAFEPAASNLAPSPQNDTVQRPGSSSTTTTTTAGSAASSSDQLNNIFNAVRQQIQKWGENAKWKIDLVLLDNSQSRQSSPSLRASQQQQQLQPSSSSSSPAAAAPLTQNLRVTTAVGHQGYMLPVSNSTQYPMDYTAPTSLPNDMYAEDLRQQLNDSLERQRYLENIVRSQADQIHYSQAYPPDANKAIETMRSIYMMSENEQKLRYLVDTKVLHKDMEALSRKLKRVTSTLNSIETMELPPKDTQLTMETLLDERKLLKRKLHLAELRISARDAEIEYLQQLVQSNNNAQQPAQPPVPSFYPHYETSPSIRSPKPPHQQAFGSSPKRGPPYLFQQQYSPKMRHDIRPPPMSQQQPDQKEVANSPQQQQQQQQQQHMSALESLGIVADRMLSDPGFSEQEKTQQQKESSDAKKSKDDSPKYDINRSKRSIDSANALLSMPTTLMFPTQDRERNNNNNDDTSAVTSSKNKGPRGTDVTMTEASAQNVGQEQQPLKKARVERNTGGKNDEEQPNARQSPSIAALLDQPSPTAAGSGGNGASSSKHSTNHHQRRTTTTPQQFSPHATPPLAPAYESDPRSHSHPHSHQPVVPEESLPPPAAPGYRPPSPASTPKGRRHSAQQFNRTSSASHHV